MNSSEEAVWRHLLAHRSASAEEVAGELGLDVAFVQGCMDRIGSPNWRKAVDHLGGVKFDSAKPRMELVPPEAVNAIATVLTYGAAKYGDRNWEKGMRWGRPYAALQRHALAWLSGEDNDPESGMSHLWHLATNAAFLIAFAARGVGVDDRHKTCKGDHGAGVAKEEGADSEAEGSETRYEFRTRRKDVPGEG